MRISIPPELAELEDRILDAIAPCIVLSPADPADGPRRSRLGGDPILPIGAPWPSNDSGPMSFVGQLDFEELAAVGSGRLGFPSSGVLGLFFDVTSGADGTQPSHRDAWELVWMPRLDGVASRNPPDGALRVPSEPLVPDQALSLPSRADLELAEWDPDPQRAAWFGAYGEFSEHFALSQGRMPPLSAFQQQVGGHADWSERDGRAIAELVSRGEPAPANAGSMGSTPPPSIEGWRLLWQLRLLVDPATWIDRGTIYVLMRTEDLARRWFDRAWLVKV